MGGWDGNREGWNGTRRVQHAGNVAACKRAPTPTRSFVRSFPHEMVEVDFWYLYHG